jgi:hypothetical protein
LIKKYKTHRFTKTGSGHTQENLPKEGDHRCFLAVARDGTPAPNRYPARKRHFLSHLYIKCIILPRQARDKHRENSKKVPFSQVAAIRERPVVAAAKGRPERDRRRMREADRGVDPARNRRSKTAVGRRPAAAKGRAARRGTRTPSFLRRIFALKTPINLPRQARATHIQEKKLKTMNDVSAFVGGCLCGPGGE